MRSRLPKMLPPAARRIEASVVRARRYVEIGDCGTALMYLRIAAEAWGQLYEQVHNATERGDSGAARLHRLVEREGERLLVLQGHLEDHCLRSSPPVRRGFLRRLFSKGR